jgi:hypothetical protein
MIIKYFKSSLFCLFLLQTACAGPGYFEPVEPLHDDEAIVYVYRPKSDNPGLQPLRFSYPDILVNGESAGLLKFNRHMAIRVVSGKHVLKATGLTRIAKWKPKDRELEFQVTPGEIKYVKLKVDYDSRNIGLGKPKAEYIVRLTPMDSDSAIYEIRETDEM